MISILTVALAAQVNASCLLTSERSIMLAASPWCDEVRLVADEVSDKLFRWLKPETSPTDYWQQWSLKSRDNPVVSSRLSDNYFGLGFWMPEKLEEDAHDMTTEEWLRSHGLLFSVGFGERQKGEPRMRFDYRWHDDADSDLMMQVEVPF
nr:hypothetical protein [Vibrio agarilyticus]